MVIGAPGLRCLPLCYTKVHAWVTVTVPDPKHGALPPLHICAAGGAGATINKG